MNQNSLEHIEYVNIQKKYFKHLRHTNRVCRGAPDFSDDLGLTDSTTDHSDIILRPSMCSIMFVHSFCALFS